MLDVNARKKVLMPWLLDLDRVH